MTSETMSHALRLPAIAISFVLLSGAGLGAVQGTAEESEAGGGGPWDDIEVAFKGGRLWLLGNYRYEFVDQDGFSKDAHASTLRTVLGYETASLHGFHGLLEFEDVSVIGNQLFDTSPGGDRPVVLDPDNTEINQAYLHYAHGEGGSLRLGRQAVFLDNWRFVGHAPWRQNNQSLDAATLRFDAGGFEGFYAFVTNANRVLGKDFDRGDDSMQTHLVNVSRDFEDLGKLSLYGYLLDYDDVVGLSSNTFGARFSGERSYEEVDLLYTLDLAQQSDTGDNPADYDETYSLLELGLRRGGWSVRAGLEQLGGSGDPGESMQTPLASLHRHNGWADQFVAIPDAGLQDLYLAVRSRHGKLGTGIIYHQFDAESGSMDYGSEWDAILTYALRESVTLGAKLALYDADDFSVDTEKFWVWIRLSI